MQTSEFWTEISVESIQDFMPVVGPSKHQEKKYLIVYIPKGRDAHYMHYTNRCAWGYYGEHKELQITYVVQKII